MHIGRLGLVRAIWPTCLASGLRGVLHMLHDMMVVNGLWVLIQLGKWEAYKMVGMASISWTVGLLAPLTLCVALHPVLSSSFGAAISFSHSEFARDLYAASHLLSVIYCSLDCSYCSPSRFRLSRGLHISADLCQSLSCPLTPQTHILYSI